MNANDLRQTFIDYFQSKGHTHVESSPVIPHNDPTLLFINAGMNQFKNVFLGAETRPYSRACSSQKCIRAGGKHNDLDSVGFTARHHTFFEMLGNFSFGDYFKEEAIFYCWDLLHNKLKLPKEKLYATVFENDDEAALLWKKISGLPDCRIVKMGEKDNFWSMGDTGPCGPCSEVLIDQGEGFCTLDNCKLIHCECDRFLELWNLVFMQFNRNQDGTMEKLPRPSIDTGLGLERLTAVMQGVESNYAIDSFKYLIRSVENLTGKNYIKGHEGMPFRVIADHIRCLTFALTDGAYPSNEGRGYVLRKILRRAFRFGTKLGMNEPFLYKLVSDVCEIMGKAYPEIIAKSSDIQGIIKNEEIRFQDTLSEGMKRIEEVLAVIRASKSPVISGEFIFKLYDTYGIPLDIIEDVAREENMTLDMEQFEAHMEKQRHMAKSSRTDSAQIQLSALYSSIKDSFDTPILFDGYTHDSLKTTICALIRDGKRVDSAITADNCEIILESTPFYAEKGGQIGDTGIIKGHNFSAVVNDTRTPIDGIITHICTDIHGTISVGDEVTAQIDAMRRDEIRKHHSVTHLLHYALREVLGEHVKQRGSIVTQNKLRFDFSHYQPVTQDELKEIMEITNRLIRQNHQQVTQIQSLSEARSEGAMALFGEKYGDKVRVVTIGPTKELCGGTHVRATGEIGFFHIISESSISAGVRRIEAICSSAAEHHVFELDKVVHDLSSLLSTSPLEVIAKVEKIIEDNKTLESSLKQMHIKKGLSQIDHILKEKILINGTAIVLKNCGATDRDVLRNLGDALKDKLSSGIIALGGHENENAMFLVMVTKDLVDKGYHAGELIKIIAQAAGGKGGGRPDMAQAGAKDKSKIDEALNEIINILRRG
ncbi:MAG: alanine--tRNA ligase [bacterium]|nr:alanine--tRNA ligase [bacterium]